MKNKKLIVLISILCLISIVVVLCSTVFTLQNVNINWLTTRNILSGINENNFSSASNLEVGNSIFLINKSNISSKIESQYSYIKVVSIETVFPNKITVHVAERESLFAIKLSDNNYAIVDCDLKILDYPVTNSYFSSLDTISPIKVDFENISINTNGIEKGEFFNIYNISKMLKDFAYSLQESGYSSLLSKGLISQLLITFGHTKNTIEINTRYGIKLLIDDAENLLTDKLLLGVAVYEYYHDLDFNYGTVRIEFNGTKIVASELEY